MTQITPFTCELCEARETAPYPDLPPDWREVWCNRDGCPGLHALCPNHPHVHMLDDLRDVPSLCVEGHDDSDLHDESCP